LSIGAGQTTTAKVSTMIPNASLWHFDHPHLYRAEVSIAGGTTTGSHVFESTFGVRKFEVKDSGFYLNGERIRPMGVERMAGSNLKFRMAQPTESITNHPDHPTNITCVF